MKTKKILLASFFFISVFTVKAQVGINEQNPIVNLDVQEVDKNSPLASAGISIPQVTILPAAGNRSGQIVYVTSFKAYYYWDGIVWRNLNINIVQDLLNSSSNNVISTQGFLNSYKTILPITYFEYDNVNRNSWNGYSDSNYLYYVFSRKKIRSGFDARFYFELPTRSNRYYQYYQNGTIDWTGIKLSVVAYVYDNNNNYLGAISLANRQNFSNYIRYKNNVETQNKTFYLSRNESIIPDNGDFYVEFRVYFRPHFSGNLIANIRINEARGSSDILSSSYYELQEVPHH